MSERPMLEVAHLRKSFIIRPHLFAKQAPEVKAVDDVSFHVRTGETLGLVGESGSGKSTTGRLILRLTAATGGSVTFDGVELLRLPKEKFQAYRKDLQMIFQDPGASLNPVYRVSDTLEEPLRVHHPSLSKAERKERVADLLEQVGLDPAVAGRFPHTFSGGQKQRISIARALSVRPRFIVADEPVSALDVSIQSQVLTLMEDLKGRYGLSYLFISHDLSVVRHMSQRVAIMYRGRVVETASSTDIYKTPAHPYTQTLLNAIPRVRVNRSIRPPQGAVAPSAPPVESSGRGCAFCPRCPFATLDCGQTTPELREIAPAHWAACHIL
jgi:oligopeptide/dipeptide ABC transporter ATP-binding protein